jgi:hypothetical protein
MEDGPDLASSSAGPPTFEKKTEDDGAQKTVHRCHEPRLYAYCPLWKVNRNLVNAGALPRKGILQGKSICFSAYLNQQKLETLITERTEERQKKREKTVSIPAKNDQKLYSVLTNFKWFFSGFIGFYRCFWPVFFVLEGKFRPGRRCFKFFL